MFWKPGVLQQDRLVLDAHEGLAELGPPGAGQASANQTIEPHIAVAQAYGAAFDRVDVRDFPTHRRSGPLLWADKRRAFRRDATDDCEHRMHKSGATTLPHNRQEGDWQRIRILALAVAGPRSGRRKRAIDGEGGALLQKHGS